MKCELCGHWMTPIFHPPYEWLCSPCMKLWEPTKEETADLFRDLEPVK